MKKLNILFVLIIALLAGCNKEKGSYGSNEDIEGIWILKGASGVGLGGRLVFFEKSGTNT